MEMLVLVSKFGSLQVSKCGILFTLAR